MNFIQLVQMTKREAGIAGVAPTTVLNQVEEINRVSGWVNAAWLDIQTMHAEWEFMRNAFSFNTTATQGTYTPAQAGVTSLGNWKRNSLRKYLVANGASGEMIFPFLDYDTFRNMYLFGSMRTQYAPPAVFSIDPQKNLVLGNIPDAIYNVNGEYYAKPTTLALDADAPTMPDQFHAAIVWKAISHYGMYEAANEAVARGAAEYKAVLGRLESDQLPKITWGAPLA